MKKSFNCGFKNTPELEYNAQSIKLKTDTFISSLYEFVESAGYKSLNIQKKYNKMVAESFDLLDFKLFLLGDRRLTHGDLSPGNVVFNERNEAFILDFETASRSFKNTVFDYCMIYLRYFLDLPKTSAQLGINHFVKLLSEVCGIDISSKEFIHYLNQHVYYTIAIVSYLVVSGDVFRASEWNKLHRWYSLTRAVSEE